MCLRQNFWTGQNLCCDIYEVRFVGESNPCKFSEGKGNRNQKSILLSKPWRDCKDRFAVTRKLEELISGQDRIRIEKQNFRMDRRQQAAENRVVCCRVFDSLTWKWYGVFFLGK